MDAGIGDFSEYPRMTRPNGPWLFHSNPDRPCGPRPSAQDWSNPERSDETPSPRSPAPNRHDAFSQLYQRHSREVWALVYARWINVDTALDLTQETFLRLWKQWEAGEMIFNPRAWLLRVARNLAEDHGKSAFRRNGTHPPETMNDVASAGLSPPAEALRRELLQALQEALNQLPELYRLVLVRHHMEDQDLADIAREIGRSVRAVGNLLWRARERLRRSLGSDADDGDQAAAI
jgi:RNA polymerase sigma-70 factor (ECF subfamily)